MQRTRVYTTWVERTQGKNPVRKFHLGGIYTISRCCVYTTTVLGHLGDVYTVGPVIMYIPPRCWEPTTWVEFTQ